MTKLVKTDPKKHFLLSSPLFDYVLIDDLSRAEWLSKGGSRGGPKCEILGVGETGGEEV